VEAARLLRAVLAVACASLAAGCASPRYFLEDEELARFLEAGPLIPELDDARVVVGLGADVGPYRLTTGDLIEFTGPAVLFAPAGAGIPPGSATHLARVDGMGRVHLPVAGYILAEERTLSEVEQAAVDAVYPRYVRHVPTVIARVVEHCRMPVAVLGAVERPGVHALRHDELTLFGALTAAGGIAKSNNLATGARLIRILRPGDTDAQAIALPVKGLDVPFANVELEGGETIEVVRYVPDTFTVVGLIESPGAFEYPPGTRYNLMQALATAGGVDLIADPPYATIFRRDAQGAIVPGTFRIRGNDLVRSSALEIKPGDVIVVGQTPATWTRTLLVQITRIQIGFFADREIN
jgi:protein involved in polysaccharide export with SLBB domain